MTIYHTLNGSGAFYFAFLIIYQIFYPITISAMSVRSEVNSMHSRAAPVRSGAI